jgi:hypothetical protein
MFDTFRVIIVYVFWLILGFVLFYDYLVTLTFDWSSVKKWFLSLKNPPKKVVSQTNASSKPFVDWKKVNGWFTKQWQSILTLFKAKTKKTVIKQVEKPVVKPVEKTVKPVEKVVVAPKIETVKAVTLPPVVTVEKPVEIVKKTVGRKEKVKDTVTPVVQTKFLTAEDSQDEDDDMEDVVFFADTLVERSTFYPSLRGRIKDEFDRLFVNPGDEHIVPELVYTVSGNNADFFADIFKYIFRYRKLISLELLQRVLDELLSMTSDPASMTLLYEAFVRVAYARRQQKGFLDAAKLTAEKDVKLHQEVLNTKDAYIYSFVRLAIILEKQQRISEALAVVQDAISRGLDDKTTTKFEGRRSRLLSKKNK